MGEIDPRSKLLDLTDSERAFHIELRGLSIDPYGNEVLVGLTREESEFYVECLHLRAKDAALVRGETLDRWVGLDEKHEFSRFSLITAEGSKIEVKS